jgi:hypothetical protein
MGGRLLARRRGTARIVRIHIQGFGSPIEVDGQNKVRGWESVRRRLGRESTRLNQYAIAAYVQQESARLQAAAPIPRLAESPGVIPQDEMPTPDLFPQRVAVAPLPSIADLLQPLARVDPLPFPVISLPLLDTRPIDDIIESNETSFINVQ